MIFKKSAKDETIDLLFREYRDQLLFYIKEIVKDDFYAEDVLQKTFIQVMRNSDKIEDISSIKTKNYIITIARNMAKRSFNQNKKYADRTEPFDDNLIPIEEKYAMEILANTALSDQILECIEYLSDNDQEIINLKYTMGYNDDEISEILDLKKEAVRQRVSRAKKRLAITIENIRK